MRKHTLSITVAVLLAALVGVVLASAGPALAASVNNYFQQTTPGTKDNPLVLNGTVKVEDVRIPASITFTVAAEGTNTILVSGQFKDGAGTAVAANSFATCYSASDATGDTPSATFEALYGLSQVGTDLTGSVFVMGTNARGVLSTSAGAFEILFTETSTTNYYLCCGLEQGVTSCSGIVDFS